MSTTRINRITFEHEVILSNLTLEHRLSSIWGKILCYSGRQGDYLEQKGIISGTYIDTRNLQHAIDDVLGSQHFRGDLDVFREIFNTDGTLADETASICRGSSRESGLLMIDTFILDPEYRHIGVGIEAIQVMIRNYARDDCPIAIRIEPAQMNDLAWRFSRDSQENQQLRELGFIVDLSEFEKLTFEESQDKLSDHFERMGFQHLKRSDTLMVSDQASLL